MKSTIVITPIENIKNFSVVNNKLNTTEVYDSNLMGISLYDDFLIKDNARYKILQMISK